MTDDTKVKDTDTKEDAKTSSLAPKLQKLVEELGGLTVLELSEVVKELQEKWGVSPMTMAAPSTGQAANAGDAQGEGSAASGSTSQTVIMTGAGANKISVIKALREINPNLGLKEAKDMTDKLPAEILKDAKADDAKSAVEKLKAAGATVEVK